MKNRFGDCKKFALSNKINYKKFAKKSILISTDTLNFEKILTCILKKQIEQNEMYVNKYFI